MGNETGTVQRTISSPTGVVMVVAAVVFILIGALSQAWPIMALGAAVLVAGLIYIGVTSRRR